MAALIVIVLVAVAYVQALGGGFLWDDRLLILGVPLVERTAPLGEYLRHPFWMGGTAPETTSYYRPLVTLSFALDHRLHGENPAGYHLTNFVLHELNALLLLALLRRFGVRPFVAALVASAWALLPRLAEAAAWVSGRTDSLAAVCVLSALVLWGNSLARRLGASVLVGAGLLAKESALAGAVALLVLAWTESAPAPRADKAKSVARRLWPLALVLTASAALRFSAVGVHIDGEPLGAARRLATVLDTVTTYTSMLVDVFRPRAVIGRVGVIRPWGVAVGAAIVVVLAVLLVRRRRSWRPASVVGLTLACSAILPVLHIVPVPLRTLAADRFLYLPTAGLALALAPSVDAWLAERRSLWLASVGLVVALGWSAAHRAGVWSDEVEFWVQTYLETPTTNSAAATNLTGVFYRAGLYGDALELAERERSYDDPAKRQARYNAALAMTHLGRQPEALALLLAARSSKHPAADTETQIAILEVQVGRFDGARDRLRPLAAAGNTAARVLLARMPEFERARAELARVPADATELRARLATFLGEETIAVPAWVTYSGDPTATQAALHAGLQFLVQTGARDAITTVARRYSARFGALEPELAGIVSVRLDEIDHVLAARTRVGLHG